MMKGTAIWILGADVLTCSGEQASWYLHGQLSANIESMFVGETRRSLLLEPDGTLVVPLAVNKRAQSEFLLFVPTGSGGVAKARLERFKLRTKVSFEDAVGSMLGVSSKEELEVTRLLEVLEDRIANLFRTEIVMVGEMYVTECYCGLTSVDSNSLLGDLEEFDQTQGGRILAGQPEWGREIQAGMNPTELGEIYIRSRTDFEKGCYTGQELIERVDSRNYNTPRKLSCFLVKASELPSWPGEAVVSEGTKPAFTITSYVIEEPGGYGVAMGFVHRLAGEFRQTMTVDGARVDAVVPGMLAGMLR